MSTLTIGLAVVGGLVLAGVIAHGTWTTRRNAPKLAEHESGLTEPSDGTEQIEPVFESFAAPPPVQVEKRLGLDALIDVIAPIALDTVVSGDAALQAMPTSRRAGTKPMAVEGHNEQTQQWELPSAGQRYSAFQAGVQLANRSGPLNEIEFSEFVVKAQAFADQVSGAPDFPDMRGEVARARELDQFASEHDAQLSFTLRARQAAWSPGYVQQHGSRAGFVAGVIPGRMVLPGTGVGSSPILSLSFDTQAALSEDPDQSALRELTLSLDLPQVPRQEQPFQRMRQTAQALAEAMDGVLTDDQGHLIAPQAMDAIAADVEQLYDTLDARDLSAGSPLARRLFS